MHILLLTQVFPPQTGGSGRWFWELYRRLTAIQVRVVTADFPGAEGFDASTAVTIERMPLRPTTWGISSLRGAAQHLAMIARLMRMTGRTRPDVLHAGKSLPEGLLAFAIRKARGIPYWCFAHGEELTLARTSRELRWLTQVVLQGAEKIVANSQFTVDLLVDDWKVRKDRVVQMHPGVDTARFVPTARDATTRERLGWSNRTVLLTVGALQRRKGQDTMIRALKQIRAQRSDVLYVMAGDGPDRSVLERLVVEEQVGDLVQFRRGPTDDELVACYQQCDLFCLPNRQVGWDVEGFGMVLLEAQACGKPVLAGNSGGTTDTMDVGVTGELVDATSPESLAAAVIHMLSEPARLDVMGVRAREWVCARFDWSMLANTAQAIFEGRASMTPDALQVPAVEKSCA